MDVHLVGSIGLDTVDDVFAAVGKLLGPHLRRIPDGEVGGRRLWISWQYPLLRASPFLRPDPSGAIRPTNCFPLLTLAEGVAPADVHFGELGYAREARASYLDFVAARENGTLPQGIRFQVCLPTPFAVVSSVVVPAAVPDDVELGLHLCYGDFGARHFVEPKDAAQMVDFANALAAAMPHRLAYIHMPVPIGRSDDAFHRPFRDLKLGDGTALFLGLVHAKDGVEGTKARIAAARRHAPAFGIATECGMARSRSEETVRTLLKIHADVCASA